MEFEPDVVAFACLPLVGIKGYQRLIEDVAYGFFSGVFYLRVRPWACSCVWMP